jgi:hypothetical protein
VACDQFCAVFELAVDEWQAQVSAVGYQGVKVRTPHCDQLHEVGLNVYADDTRSAVFSFEDPTAVIKQINEISREMGTSLQPHGIFQNKDKMEVQYHCSGPGGQKRQKAVQAVHREVPGKLTHLTKYPGAQIHADGHLHVEITKGLQAMRESWQIFKKFSCGKSNIKMRKFVCMSMIYNHGLSGMEAWAVPRKQADRLTSLFARYVRSMMRGDACSKTDNTFHAQSNDEVYRWLGVLPFHLLS